jgi:hypothetical protein
VVVGAGVVVVATGSDGDSVALLEPPPTLQPVTAIARAPITAGRSNLLATKQPRDQSAEQLARGALAVVEGGRHGERSQALSITRVDRTGRVLVRKPSRIERARLRVWLGRTSLYRRGLLVCLEAKNVTEKKVRSRHKSRRIKTINFRVGALATCTYDGIETTSKVFEILDNAAVSLSTVCTIQSTRRLT